MTHLWLGDTGVSGWSTEVATERYCSDVAAEMLLPPRELAEFDGVTKLSFEQVAELVSKFAHKRRISRAMVAYRVFRMNFISKKTWNDLNELFKQEWLAQKEKEFAKQGAREGGPSYYVVKRHRIGKALLDLADRSLGDGLLTYTKAGRLLGVRARNVEPLLSADVPSRGRG